MICHTMWSVNDGLSRNLWKPPETSRGGFWQVSGSFYKKKKLNDNKKFGNLLETSGNRPRRFPAGFRIFF